MLKQGNLNSQEMERYLKLIFSQAILMQTFVEDLMNLRHLKDGGELTLNNIQFNPHLVVKTIIDIFQPIATQKKVELSYEPVSSFSAIEPNRNLLRIISTTDDLEQYLVLGDDRRFQQVLINLVKNALKFTPKYGAIRLKAVYSDDKIEMAVKDTGAGIAPEDFAKLFTRFGKLHRTAAINSAGIGLGLTIVKQIVEAYGGTVNV